MSRGDLTFTRRWVGDTEVLPTDFRWEGRPLAVIPFEDREQVERLVRAMPADWSLTGFPVEEADVLAESIDGVQAALREFANPKPPKPDEPTGLGAVVEDEGGAKWVRAGHSYTDPNWRRAGGDDWTRYADIPAVRVLSEGVQ